MIAPRFDVIPMRRYGTGTRWRRWWRSCALPTRRTSPAGSIRWTAGRWR